MSDSKVWLRSALRDLPEGFQSLLGEKVPAMPSAPSDVDAAIILNGQLAAFLIALFTKLEGLEILEVPLRISQFVPSLDGLLAASLKESGRKYGDFQIAAPVVGQTYAPGAQTVAVEILNSLSQISEVTCELQQIIDGEPNVSRVTLDALEEGSSTFIADVEYFTGELTCVFMVSFLFDGSSAVITKTISVTVLEAS